ncbi:MAG: hypothetical protein IJV13_03245 [Prevotella sp.]|nr:hypothetical protein [Prevotella sp.]
MGKVVVSPEALAKSAAKYRREILMMPVFALGEFLKHVSLRTGIRYSETVGEMSGSMELGPYSETRIDDDDVQIVGRTLYTYFGSVVKKFSPNKVYQSIYGNAITKGEGLKNVDITREVLNFLGKKVGNSLYWNMWNAVRNDNGTKTKDLFNGFDTITSQEITAGNIAVAKKNLLTLTEDIDATNAVDVLKTIWRSADPMLKREKCKLFVPPSVLDAYNDDYKATTGSIAYNTKFNQTFVEGSENKCEIVAIDNKAGSEFLHLTTRQNMLVGVNQTGEEETVAVEKHEAFVLQFIMTAFFGCQFESISPERMLAIKLKAAAQNQG